MNIFVLDEAPDEAAKMHCDKHVVKMVLESTQILCTVWHLKHNMLLFPETAQPISEGYMKLRMLFDGGHKQWMLDDMPLYLPTHVDHPCVKWASVSIQNYNWLWELAYNLCAEYKKRYGKVHACRDMITGSLSYAPARLVEEEIGLTPFAQAMPKNLQQRGKPVEAYRAYYMQYKSGMLVYTNREPPAWMVEAGAPHKTKYKGYYYGNKKPQLLFQESEV